MSRLDFRLAIVVAGLCSMAATMASCEWAEQLVDPAKVQRWATAKAARLAACEAQNLATPEARPTLVAVCRFLFTKTSSIAASRGWCSPMMATRSP